MSKTYQTKPTKVKAWQATNSGIIQTGRDEQDPDNAHIPVTENYSAGDWVVTFKSGVRRVYSNDLFNAYYELSENN